LNASVPADYPALALLEFDSIAIGILAGDAMVKRAPIAMIRSGTVQPGHYLVLVAGDVASVGESVEAGRLVGQAALRDLIFLPNVHPGVVAGLTGSRAPSAGEALGIVETKSVATAIAAADAGLKEAAVRLWQLRLADGLGGKGLALFSGIVTDVEAAVSRAAEQSGAQLLRQVVIAQLHAEMRENVDMGGRFGDHYEWRIA
jgi:microcompartment protein CcmL/EutN